MIVCESDIAARAGADILKQGGNAVDAAVAVGFAMAVAHPADGNLGGGGFMLVKKNGRSKAEALDYREVAPRAARRDMFVAVNGEVDTELARWSPQAAGVPGTVAGLALAHRRYGRLPWRRLLAPAARLAEEGFAVDACMSTELRDLQDRLAKWPASRGVFLPRGRLLAAGNVLRQPQLAATLRHIAQQGAAGFYRGETARRFALFMRRHGGLITEQDLRDYQPRRRTPVVGEYRGYDLESMPPPSSGGTLLVQMLEVLKGFDLRQFGTGSPQALHLIAEAERRAFADRAVHFGDPDFVGVPVAWLISPAHVNQLRGTIDPAKATPSDQVHAAEPPTEGPDTTHFSIVDRDGMAVSNTYSLNFSYGSGIVVEGCGFLLNNTLDDFSALPASPNAYGLVGAEANALQPGKRPLSSMTPTLVSRGGKVVVVTGSPGGPRIISAVLQVLLNLLEFRLPPAEAVRAPRLHHQWKPDTLYAEPGINNDTLEVLRGMGHKVEEIERVGLPETIVIEGGLMTGVPDPRRPGVALGVP